MSSDSTELDSLNVKWRKSYYIIEFLINHVHIIVPMILKKEVIWVKWTKHVSLTLSHKVP